MSFSWRPRHGYRSDPTAASSLYTWPPDLVESCCLDATPLYQERWLEGGKEGEEGGREEGGGGTEMRSPKGGTPLTVQLEGLMILNFEILQF